MTYTNKIISVFFCSFILLISSNTAWPKHDTTHDIPHCSYSGAQGPEPTALEFHYKPSPLSNSDNGHTLVDAYEPGSYKVSFAKLAAVA